MQVKTLSSLDPETRARLERLFRERTLGAYRSRHRFLLLGALASLCIYVIGVPVFFGLLWIGMGAMHGDILKPIVSSPGVFFAVYTLLFFMAGYGFYRALGRPRRRRTVVPAPGDEPHTVEIIARPYPQGGAGLWATLLAWPSLVFELLGEARKKNVEPFSDRVETMALEVLVDGGDSITEGFIRKKAAECHQDLQAALDLLLRSRLLLPSKIPGDEIAFLRSITGTELLEDAGVLRN